MPDFNSLLQQLAEGRNSTFLRFVAVGLLSNLANFVTYLGCIGLGFNYFYAALIGYMVGLVNSFVLGRFFVFNKTESGPTRPLHQMILLFLLVYGSGGFIMATGVNFSVTTLQMPSTPSWLAVAAFVVFWNYFGSKLIVFRGNN